MKRLLQLVLGGTAAFLVVAMIQEWSVFDRALFGGGPAPASLDEAEKREATDALRLSLRLMEHLYASGGDPRFADRLPVAEPVLEELLADVEYVARNRRVQVMKLRKLEVTDVRATGVASVEIHSRELWEVRYRRPDGEALDEPMRIQVTRARYLLARTGGTWRVLAWSLLDPFGDEAP